MRKLLPLTIALAASLSQEALAQTAPVQGIPKDALSRNLSVTAQTGQANLHANISVPKAQQFTAMIVLTTAKAEGIGVLPRRVPNDPTFDADFSRGEFGGTGALTSGGARCTGYDSGQRYSVFADGNIPVVSAAAPLTVIVSFGCDRTIAPGETVTIQLTLVLQDAGRSGIGSWTFPNVMMGPNR